MAKRRQRLDGAEARTWLQEHPKAQARLIREGSRFLDPLTRKTFSARQVQKVSTGYYPEQLAVERRFQQSGAKEAGEDLERLITSYRAAQSRAKRKGKGKGLLPRAQAVAADSPLWQLLKDLRSPDTSPRGRKARALVALGLRDPQSRIRVGASPKAEARRTTTRTRSQLSRRERMTGKR